MLTSSKRRAVRGLLVVPADSPYIDRPPRSVTWLGDLLCLVSAAASTAVLLQWGW